jgi:hypothetical protein
MSTADFQCSWHYNTALLCIVTSVELCALGNTIAISVQSLHLQSQGNDREQHQMCPQNHQIEYTHVYA